MALVLTRVVPVEGDDDEAEKAQTSRSNTASKKAWDSRSDAVSANADRRWHDYWFHTALFVLAVLENSLYYAVFFSVRGFNAQVNNVVEAQLVLMDWTMPALMVFTALGTLCFVLLLVLVECNGLPWYHEIMNIRLYFCSFPCAALSCIIFWYCEQTQWAPFVAICSTALFVTCWCLHMRLRWWHQLNVLSRVCIDVAGLFALVFGAILTFLFFTGRLDAITKSGDMRCPYADNVEMPVLVPMLGQWFCAPWGQREKTLLMRPPRSTAQPVQLGCSDTFLDAFGASLEVHAFACPSGCLRSYSGTGVYGCGIYSMDSKVCIAALHAGVLTDRGGFAVVYGRLGVSLFQSCSGNGVMSDPRLVTDKSEVQVSMPSSATSPTAWSPYGGGRRLGVVPPLVLDSSGVRIPQAFHFNNKVDTQEYMWLRRYDILSTSAAGVNLGKPWTRLEAMVDARVVGVELRGEKVRLGQPEDLLWPSGSSLASPQSPRCQLNTLGLVCSGATGIAVSLDFCQPEKGSCLA